MSREKLSKLILMLSSDNDGEVVNAARAIGRTLPACQLDWHKLAAILSSPSSIVPPPKPRPSPQQSNASSYATPEDWARIDALFNKHLADLMPNEKSFIKQLVTSGRIYSRDKTFMTTRQRMWLHAIHAKYAP